MKRATLTLLALAAALALQAQVRVTFVGASITEGAGTARPAAESYPAQAPRRKPCSETPGISRITA